MAGPGILQFSRRGRGRGNSAKLRVFSEDYLSDKLCTLE